MPLNAVGPLSIGGNTSGQSINLELGKGATESTSLNDPDFRTFVGIPAPNEIALEDFYGFLSPVLVTRSGQYSTSAWETNISLGDLSAYYGQTCRLVFKYVAGSSFTGDIQLDNVRLVSGLSGTTTYSFENNAEGWETTTSDAYGIQYQNLSWSTLATGITASRWNMDSAGTPSSSTGLTFATAGSYYVYAETSTSPNGQTYWLRSPTFNIPIIGGYGILFDCARYGATIGTLEVYLEVVRTRRGTSYGTLPSPLTSALVTRSGQYSSTSWETGISFGNLSAYYGKTFRIVFKYVSGTNYTGDIQLDNIRATVPGGTYIASFESNSGEYWQTTTVNSTDTIAYNDLIWSSLVGGNTANRWNVDANGTGSGGTGLSFASSGTYYVFAETSSPGYPNKVFWLRSPELTAPSSGTFNITFDCARYGATIGTLEAYLEITG